MDLIHQLQQDRSTANDESKKLRKQLLNVTMERDDTRLELNAAQLERDLRANHCLQANYEANQEPPDKEDRSVIANLCQELQQIKLQLEQAKMERDEYRPTRSIQEPV